MELSEEGFLSIVSVIGSSSGEWFPALENTFLTKNASDKLFTVSVDNNDKATLRFGDGISGAMPGDDLTVTYKTGGGSAGNVAAASIVKIDGTILDFGSNVVDLAATNARAATGGAERETAESIRMRAPLSIRNPTTTVTREDFEDHAATAVSCITRALMLNSDLDESIERNSGVLYVVLTGTAPNIGFPTFAKLDEVRRIFVGDTQSSPVLPAPMCFELDVLPAVYLDIAVTAKVFLKRGADAAATKAAIVAALVDYFSPVLPSDGTPNPRINFGYYLRILSGDDSITQGEIPLSDLINVVRDVDGVFKVGAAEADFMIDAGKVVHDPVADTDTTTPILSGAHADVALNDSWFPRLRLVGGVPDVTLIDGATGVPI